MAVDTEWFMAKIRECAELRPRDGLPGSQRQLAVRMGLDQASVSRMLSGERKVSLEEACQLSEILGVSLKEIARRCGY